MQHIELANGFSPFLREQARSYADGIVSHPATTSHSGAQVAQIWSCRWGWDLWLFLKEYIISAWLTFRFIADGEGLEQKEAALKSAQVKEVGIVSFVIDTFVLLLSGWNFQNWYFHSCFLFLFQIYPLPPQDLPPQDGNVARLRNHFNFNPPSELDMIWDLRVMRVPNCVH